MKEFEIKQDREFLMKRMGDISQLAGRGICEVQQGSTAKAGAVETAFGSGICAWH